MPESCPTSWGDQRARVGFSAVASLACLGYLNALGLSGLCDPAEDTPLDLDRPCAPRPDRWTGSGPR